MISQRRTSCLVIGMIANWALDEDPTAAPMTALARAKRIGPDGTRRTVRSCLVGDVRYVHAWVTTKSARSSSGFYYVR